jgi:thiamine biosynthesis protein ThiI
LNTKVSQTPFAETQKEIVKKTNSSYRIILYRRQMMRLAEVYAKKIGAQAIITGESLGQVASQTIENITVIEDAVSIPILRPLIGFDKNEIIEIAKKIGTFETSILPHEDCCSLFMPKNPIIRSTLNEVKKEEENLDLKI